MERMMRPVTHQKAHRHWKTFVLGLAVILFPQMTLAKTINVGSVGDLPTDEIKKFVPLASFLARQLQPEGFDQGKVVVARSISEMALLLKDGKVDLYIDSPFPSVAVSHLSGSKFLLLRLKKGLSEYHSVIFVREDSRINRLQDLNQKIIAFKEPFSSSAYFIPKMVLAQEGLKLVPKKDFTDSVGAREVGYIFSNDSENTMVWVLRKKVAAGALDNQSYENEARGNLNSLKILYKTFSFPRHIVSYRANLPPALVAKFKEILINMHQSEEGKKALEDFEKTTRFDELPDQAMAPFLKAGKFIDAEFGIK